MKVIKYCSEFEDEWNKFIECSKNATFLFNRNFLEYHSDRFVDYSLMVIDDNNRIVAVVPANLTGNEVISHQGLSYGGLVLPQDAKLGTVLTVFYHILKHLDEQQVRCLNLKLFPSFYNIHPTDELEFCLFLLHAELYRRDVAFTIDMHNRIPCSGNIRREANKAEKSKAELITDDTFDSFWNDVLTPNLQERFGVMPVHSLEEIKLLHSRFPENIKQYNVYQNGKIAAGTTLFLAHQVVHCQYISATDFGRKAGCLNYLFKCLLDDVFPDRRFFDFGIVNENDGRKINNGMLFWKESFGGRAQKHDFYKVNTGNYKTLESYIKA